jgi:hypothetical protein
MPSRGLSEFLAIAKDLKKIQSLVFKGMVAVPLAAIWLKLGPPTDQSTAALLTVAELLVLVSVFQLWYPLSRSKLHTRFLLSTGLCFIAIVAMIYLFERYTVAGPGKERVVIGTQVREEVSRVLRAGYTPYEALGESEYDATKVWTPDSIKVITTLMQLNWLSAVVTYTASLGTFVMLQRKRMPTKTVRRRFRPEADPQ